MTLSPPFSVRVAKPETAIADAMNEMRTWLDNNRLQPVQFKIVFDRMTGIAFDVMFRSEAEAILFAQVFA
jgi:hypothetical protein